MSAVKLRQIVANVLGVPPDEIQKSSSPREFPQWDSAAHIDIVLSVEVAYGVTFRPKEMMDSLSVGALEEVLRSKGAAFE